VELEGRLRAVSKVVVICTLGAACANAKVSDDGGSPADASIGADGGVDAAGATPARPGAEVVTAAGRIKAGAITMDVELGHPYDQRAVTAGTRTLRGAAVVTP